MKILTALFILTFSINTFAQATKTVQEIEQQKKAFKHDKRYSVLYDKFEDETVVRTLGFNMIGLGESFAEALVKSTSGYGGYGGRSNLSTLYLGAAFMFSGETLTATPEEYYLLFYYSGDEWQFLKKSKLIALVDDERMLFGDGEAIRDVERGGVTEKIGFKVSKDQLKKLSEAKKVEIKIGNYVKPLKPEYLEMFGNVLKLGDVELKAEAKRKK